jgi:hypothetical protein
LALSKTPFRQRPQNFHFFDEAFFPSAVELFEQSLQEQLVFRH